MPRPASLESLSKKNTSSSPLNQKLGEHPAPCCNARVFLMRTPSVSSAVGRCDGRCDGAGAQSRAGRGHSLAVGEVAGSQRLCPESSLLGRSRRVTGSFIFSSLSCGCSREKIESRPMEGHGVRGEWWPDHLLLSRMRVSKWLLLCHREQTRRDLCPRCHAAGLWQGAFVPRGAAGDLATTHRRPCVLRWVCRSDREPCSPGSQLGPLTLICASAGSGLDSHEVTYS